MPRKTLYGVGLFLLVLAGGQGLVWTGWLNGPEASYQDLWHHLSGVRYQPSQVVLVSVGDDTLEAHSEEPLVTWTRHFARVVQVLRDIGAGAIGLDYLFQVSLESWLKKEGLAVGEDILTFDQPLKAQLASGEVVIAGRLIVEDRKKTKIVLPVREFTASLPRPPAVVGLINLAIDSDGATRSYMPALEDSYGEVYLTFPQLLAVRWRGLDPVQAIERFKTDPRLQVWSGFEEGEAAFPYIGFAGPPGTFPRIPFERLLAPGAAQDPEVKALKGKVVIVAYEPTGSQDLHLTPYGKSFWWGDALDMSGAEIHANIVETILNGRGPREAPKSLSLAVQTVFLAVGFLLFFRLSSWLGLLTLTVLAMTAAALSYWLFLQEMLLPLASVQVSLALGYVGVLGLRLTGEERERARLRRIFGRYVAPEIVEKLLAEGTRPNLGGEAYRVTVLFSDIRNFTTMAESLAPGQVVEILNTYFSRAIEPILTAGGMVDKFVGDAIMAVFGAPVPHADHARRALQAALGLTQEVQEFQNWLSDRFPGHSCPSFRIGVGLHTGEAVVGNIGSPKRLEYTAIGDTVNTAARLEGLSKELGWTIVASQATLEAAGPGVLVGQRQTVAVKGRQELVEVGEILGLDSG
jgi:adenylate cyclase